jgi:hypothetical protein
MGRLAPMDFTGCKKSHLRSITNARRTNILQWNEPVIVATQLTMTIPDLHDQHTVFLRAMPRFQGIAAQDCVKVIIEEEGDSWDFEEGCLSIPGIREKVRRDSDIMLEYQDENFEIHTERYDGLLARVIQHEHDHTDGILFVDHLSALRRNLLKKRLIQISLGLVQHDYKMRFPKKRR